VFLSRKEEKERHIDDRKEPRLIICGRRSPLRMGRKRKERECPQKVLGSLKDDSPDKGGGGPLNTDRLQESGAGVAERKKKEKEDEIDRC